MNSTVASRAHPFVAFFKKAGERYKLEPTLLGGICDHESRCGRFLDLNGTGDGGNGLGLMQIDGRYHGAWAQVLLNGKPQWQDPEQNILRGAFILRENLDYFKGDIYGAIAAYNCARTHVNRIKALNLSQGPYILELNKVCTHGPHGPDYVTDVLARKSFLDAEKW
jgi:soluble lytic murein transglycosylase-like protein